MNNKIEITNNNSEIMLAILAQSTINIIFSECAKPFVHTTSFMLATSACENYFKAKLFEIDYKIIFTKAQSVEKRGKSISLSGIPPLLKKYFDYNIDANFFKDICLKRNELFHFASGVIDSSTTLKLLFGVVIPFLEKYFPKDLHTYFDYLSEYDDAIFENYLIEQLDLHNIGYSKTIDNKFRYAESRNTI